MGEADTATRTPPVAILCLGDINIAEAALPLTPLYGQPLFHHSIKQLQALGIKQFLIQVESVPAALLSYRDDALDAGLHVDFVRNPEDVVAKSEQAARFLVLRADHLWDPKLIGEAIGKGTPLVATVEERGENCAFERIDLNHRWAGLAIVEQNIVRALAQLPEGWDLASALMRQAVQEDIAFWPLRQADIDAGPVLPLRSTMNLETARARLTPSMPQGSDNLERRLLAKAIPTVTAALWRMKHGRDIANHTFPALTATTLGMALLRFPVAASILGLLAIFAGLFRQSVRTVEYRTEDADPVMLASWAALAAAVLTLLAFTPYGYLDPVWLGLVLIGLMLSAAWERQRFVFTSPLVVALALLAGFATEATLPLLQGLVLAEIGLLVLHKWRIARQGLQSQQT